jgi:hypothetical protein
LPLDAIEDATMFYITDIIPLLVFFGIVMGIWSVLSMISDRNSRAVDRLARVSRPQTASELDDPVKGGAGEKLKGILETAKARSSCRP